MKILHVGKFYPPFWGGIEKVNADIVESLNDEGWQIDELCFAHKPGFMCSEDANRTFSLFRVPICRILLSTPIPKGFFRLFLRIRNNYDIIHIHLPNPLASLALLLPGLKAKVVVHWHSDIIRQRKLLFFYRPFERLLLSRASCVIATSDGYAKGSASLKRVMDKVKVVPIGIDIGHLDVVAPINASIPVNGRRLVLSLGRLVGYKGFEFLIEAAKGLPEDCCVVIGGEGRLRAKLEQMVAEAGLQDRVFLPGRIPQDELGALFRKAEVFVLPSVNKAEAFGIVMIEAMSLGIPVVSCNVPYSGVPWVNQDGVSGLVVEPGDIVGIRNALLRLLSDDDLRKNLSEAGRKRYLDLFTRDRMVEGIKEIYNDIYSSSKH